MRHCRWQRHRSPAATAIEPTEPASPLQPSTPERELVERALTYLRAHLDAALSVAGLAVAVHVSPRTLQRALRRVLAQSPKEVILSVKMEESRRLLAGGALRVSEVAYRLGFASADHFSRRFKRYHGVTPSSVVPA